MSSETSVVRHRFARKTAGSWSSTSAAWQSICKEKSPMSMQPPSCSGACWPCQLLRVTCCSYWEQQGRDFPESYQGIKCLDSFCIPQALGCWIVPPGSFSSSALVLEKRYVERIYPLASQPEGAKSNISRVYQTDGHGTSAELSQESQHCYHKPILSFDFENMLFLFRRNFR